MGGCNCSVYERGVEGTNGGRLQWYWCDGANCGRYIAVRQWCKPMNCSNNACYKKGCAAAREEYCKRYGYYCASKQRKICLSESCPGGAIDVSNCTNSISYHNLTGTPLCKDQKPIQTGPGYKPPVPPKTSTSPGGVDADCKNYGGLGGVGEWFCIQGKSATKGLQQGGIIAGDIGNQVGRWMPIMMMGFAAIAAILLIQKVT